MHGLTKDQKKLWKRISVILWKDWDPIGIYEKDADWNDEYDSYVPHIYRLAIEGKDHERIAQSLALSRSNDIGRGLSVVSEGDLNAAVKIIEARNTFFENEHYT